jgi:predicted CxxxxCH...CXXCH cytochrome family protein
MRYIKFYLLIIVAIGFIFSSCSDLKDNITPPASVTVHGANVLNKSSQEFHAISVKNNGLESCQDCHAVKFDGGTANVSCATSNCHPTIAVHQNESGIINPSSQYYHGLYIHNNGIKMSDCNQCHGTNYGEGTASTACTQCHSTITAHKTGISDPTSANFHGKYITALNWDMRACKECHGTNYGGGTASPSCNTCHTNTGGPEACNTCHGSFSNASLTAPPRDTKGNTATTYSSVGAHSNHLLNATISSVTKCSDCHVVPSTVYATGHLGTDGKAEVVLTAAYSSYQNGTGTYDYTTYKCANTYCHGNFSFAKSSSQYSFAYTADKIEGSNYQPVWNKVDATQAACGTCHGLPPKGHMDATISSCVTCHPGVVDKYGKIVDKTKHMNGKINVFGN